MSNGFCAPPLGKEEIELSAWSIVTDRLPRFNEPRELIVTRSVFQLATRIKIAVSCEKREWIKYTTGKSQYNRSILFKACY